ncbi:hypothetical protein MKZ38_006361 [Zalerion maritima]|uniref:Uncharacterized protein n=1 Tax=Zalerion maritima TaxID=339359 RepID=A0AAD5WVW1_9PEZI|nr:hypothetical protein MKZ38_006361 [Zalerion maritima]
MQPPTSKKNNLTSPTDRFIPSGLPKSAQNIPLSYAATGAMISEAQIQPEPNPPTVFPPSRGPSPIFSIPPQPHNEPRATYMEEVDEEIIRLNGAHICPNHAVPPWRRRHRTVSEVSTSPSIPRLSPTCTPVLSSMDNLDDTNYPGEIGDSPRSSSLDQLPMEEIRGIVLQIHDICLRGSQEYLLNHRINFVIRAGVGNVAAEFSSLPPALAVGEETGRKGRRRGAGMGVFQGQPSRYRRFSPYKTPSSRLYTSHSCSPLSLPRNGCRTSPIRNINIKGNHSQPPPPLRTGCLQSPQGVHLGIPIPRATGNLLTNISLILDLAWKRAQWTRCYMLGIEELTIRQMGKVTESANKIAMTVVEASVEKEGGRDPDVEEMAKAGKFLTRWLGVEDGAREIAELAGDLFDFGDGDDDSAGNGPLVDH